MYPHFSWDYSINNRVPCIVPFLSMIVMIKGIYLITGLLNYSSAEARLFRRMLIALRSPRLVLTFIHWMLLCAVDQRFVKTATKNSKKGNFRKRWPGAERRPARVWLLVPAETRCRQAPSTLAPPLCPPTCSHSHCSLLSQPWHRPHVTDRAAKAPR